MTQTAKIITHFDDQDTDFVSAIKRRKDELEAQGDLPYMTVLQTHALLDELASFNFGKFLLTNKGANGFWTRYVMSFPGSERQKLNLDDEGKPLSKLEEFILVRCPIVIATQERFKIFQRLFNQHLKDGMILASIPCGLMDDLITLDFSAFSQIKLVGIDLDEESLKLAQENALLQGKHEMCEFRQADAFDLNIKEEFDLVTSNGLNFYENDDSKVEQLYLGFYNALKPEGMLVTSIYTLSPQIDPHSSWDMNQINQEDLLLQQKLFKDIVPLKMTAFRNEKQTRLQLESVGFRDVQFIYDRQKIMPTVIAKK